MKGIWILIILILTAALPAIVAFFLLKSRKSAVNLPWFLASIAAGIVSFLTAAFVQNQLPIEKQSGFWPVFFSLFIRIAMVEEGSRILTIFPFLRIGKNYHNCKSSFGAALGLVAGLGFAVIESAYHGITDLGIAILRIFTAAPLHAACGIRAGAAVFTARKNPKKSLVLFISSVFIHGAYNSIIVNPALSSFLAIPLTIAALFTSLNYLKTSDNENDSNLA
jgi:RsiW-degrading membrane proteinase PrsW (M82 family)